MRLFLSRVRHWWQRFRGPRAPKRLVLRLVYPSWGTVDMLELECGHRQVDIGSFSCRQIRLGKAHARCYACMEELLITERTDRRSGARYIRARSGD